MGPYAPDASSSSGIMGVGVGRCDGVGGDFEEGADTVGGRNTHSSDGGAGVSTV
jgi:hypothetical protein